MSTTSPGVDRIHAFERDFARRQADRILPVPGGFAVRNDGFPTSYEHNRLIVDATADPDAVLAAADEALGDLPHRSVSVDGTPEWGAAFAAAGYDGSVELLMRHAGPIPEAPAQQVDAVDFAVLRSELVASWRSERPDLTDAQHAQLADRRQVRLRGAKVTILAVLGPDGTPRAWCDLYVAADGGGVGQVEDVWTQPEWRGRGYARALVTEALRRARAAGCDLIFLRADADDWPKELYRRLGFAPLVHAHAYTRTPTGPVAAADRESSP